MSTNDSLMRVARAYQSEEEPERLFALAGTYWRVMLLIEILIFCAAIAAGAYMLVMTFMTLSVTNTQTSTPPTLNSKQLSVVAEGIAARRIRFEEVTQNPSTIADPSR